jgi:hypothetical protein
LTTQPAQQTTADLIGDLLGNTLPVSKPAMQNLISDDLLGGNNNSMYPGGG